MEFTKCGADDYIHSWSEDRGAERRRPGNDRIWSFVHDLAQCALTAAFVVFIAVLLAFGA